MNGENGFSSCWYNRLQGALYLLAFLTWGIGDSVTSLWMIEERGIMSEGNFFARYMIINYGISNVITIKILTTTGLLLISFFIFEESAYWIINGYFISYITGGTLAIILNIQAARNEVLFISPNIVILLFISLVVILTIIGEEIDKRKHLKIRSYFFCVRYDLSRVLSFRNKI